MIKRGLGRGLDALLPKYSENKTTTVQKISISAIKPNRRQARKKFDENKLKELAESIKHHDVVQPLVVTPSAVPGEYELIAGERRLRASKIAGLTEVPVVIKTSVTEKDRNILSLIENIQRDDLNPIEEAGAYKKIIDEFRFTQEEFAKIIGKDRSVLANTIRLLTLPEELISHIENGLISAGHGRTLAGISDAQKQKDLLKKIIDEQLTVRDVEKIISEIKRVKSGKTTKRRNPEAEQMETALQHLFGTKVKLSGNSKRGKISIYYYSLDDLERISRLLKKIK